MTVPNEKNIRENDPLSLAEANAESEATTDLVLEAANDPDDELLTAFLDGELSNEEKERLEKRLAAEPELAERYQKLRFAGRLVESLAPAPVNDRLTASTMEMLSAVVQKEIAAAEKRRFRQTLLWLAIFFFAGLATFALGRWSVARYFRPGPFAPLPEPAAHEMPADGFPASNAAPNRPERNFGPGFHGRYGDGRPDERRPRDLKQALPEELRDEDLGPVHQELFAFVKEKYGDDFPKIPKEEILYRFISERSVASFVERLSDKGKKYMEPLDDDQKIRLVGLLILTELHELRKERFNDGDRRMNPNREKNRAPHAADAKDNESPTPNNPPNNTPGNTPGDLPKGKPSDTRGFYWKNESTGELAETLQKLPPEQRDRLLNLPDEEMYAQLLILHWGFDPKQVNPSGDLHSPGGHGFPDRDFSPDANRRPNRRNENRPDASRADTNRPDRPEPVESWNRFLDTPRPDEKP